MLSFILKKCTIVSLKSYIMKTNLQKLIIPVFIILLSCNSKPGNDTETITLKFNLPTGSSFNYNVDMDMEMHGNVQGQPINMDNKMGMGYRFNAIGDSAGWRKITASINRIAMHMNSNGQKVDFDSEKVSDSTDVVSNTIGKVLGAMKGGQFGFTMNEKGEVGSVTGIQDMMQLALTSVNLPNAGAMAAGMGNAFNEDNFKQNIQQSFGMYPGKPVKPGDSWTGTMNMNNQGTAMKIDNNYTLESVSGSTANVKVNSKISSPDANAAMGISGAMTGTMKFDIPTGLPVDGDLDMNMKMTMNTGGQIVPMNTDIKMKITGNKS